MDNELIKEIGAIVNMLDHLQITMQMIEDQGHPCPLTYTYLYELGILRLLEIFGATPDFVDVMKSTTNRMLDYLLAMYKEQGKSDPLDEKLKRLNDAIQKAKKDKPKEIEKKLEDEVPDTIGGFLEKYTQESCLKTPSMKDPMDRLLDEYLAGKKRDEERKKKKSKGQDGKSKRKE
jgi:hypothetical protein